MWEESVWECCEVSEDDKTGARHVSSGLAPLHLPSPCASAPRSQQTPPTLTSALLPNWRHVRGSWQRTRFRHIISTYCVYLYFKTLASHPLSGSRCSAHTHSRLWSGDVWECGGAASEDVYTALRGGRIVFPSRCVCVYMSAL